MGSKTRIANLNQMLDIDSPWDGELTVSENVQALKKTFPDTRLGKDRPFPTAGEI